MARPFNDSQPLGQKMRELGLTVNDMVALTRINARKLSDYLAGRVAIKPWDLKILAEVLDCSEEELLTPRMKTIKVSRWDPRNWDSWDD